MKLPLHIKILIGLAAGVIYALIAAELGWSGFTRDWIAPFGDIFINLLKLIAVPLVLFSIISGVAGMSDVSKLGTLGIRTLVLYLATTVIAVVTGLFVVNLIQPGDSNAEELRLRNRINYELWVTETAGVDRPVDGQCLMCDPANASTVAEVRAARQGEVKDDFVVKAMNEMEATKARGPLQFLVDIVPSNIFLSFNNSLMLQVIFFAVFFGIMLLLIDRQKAAPVIDFVNGGNEVFMKMVEVVMKAAPFFVFALMAGVIARMAGDDPDKVVSIFKALIGYSITVILGLLIIVLIFYPAILSMFLRRPVFKKFLRAISPAQLLAFSTSSSVATLPATIKCVEDRIGVSKSTASFVLPIGATINMDGTSLYQAVAVVFLAQFHMVDLTFTQQLLIVLTATMASIGAAAVPSAGLITLIIVLTSVGLDPAWIGIILPVDRILDMCRTVVNVTGDAAVCSVVANSQGEKLFEVKAEVIV
jgi:Na+/H+-dicarboxylate symporter